MINFLTVDQVIELHDFLLQYGGLPGIRDRNLLISAIEAPKATMFGSDLYHTIYDKASAYLHGIVCNHPFNDGNKRSGFAATILFLESNHVAIRFRKGLFSDFVVEVAQNKHSREAIANFLEFGG